MRIHKVSLHFLNLWQEFLEGNCKIKTNTDIVRLKVKPWGLETLRRTLTRLLVKVCDAINNPDVKMWTFVAISFLVTLGTYCQRIRKEKSKLHQKFHKCSLVVQSWVRIFLSCGWYKLKFQANKKGREVLSLLCTVPHFFFSKKGSMYLLCHGNQIRHQSPNS